MIDLITDEWREALRLVKLAANAETGTPEREAARAAAFDYMRTAESKRILKLAHLLQPGATDRSIQAALVPLERVDNRSRITDAEMGIRTTDSPRAPDRADFVVVADNIRSAFNAGKAGPLRLHPHPGESAGEEDGPRRGRDNPVGTRGRHTRRHRRTQVRGPANLCP